jgi:alpha-galactosidase
MNQILAPKIQANPEKDLWPHSKEWAEATPVRFCADWRGENPDPQRETQVQILWSPAHLYIRFLCHYRSIYVFDDNNMRRDQLWLRDVAEIFIQNGSDALGSYREFEISPNGDWLDLDITPGNKKHLWGAVLSQVKRDAETRSWIADMAIPFDCLTPVFNPQEIWKINLFRIEGPEPNRFYSAWQPTHTPKPNFHVPERFGELRFR